MALSMNELAGLAGGACCSSCARGGPCKPDGLGSYVQTTKPNTTVISKVKRVPLERRRGLTAQVEELEALAVTPGVHSRVLAERILSLRSNLRGTRRWQGASYAFPGRGWDDHAELLERVEAVERALGVEGVSSRIAAGQLGMGGLGALRWGDRYDPAEKLAQCIAAMICRPKDLCAGSCAPAPRFVEAPFQPFRPFTSAGEEGLPSLPPLPPIARPAFVQPSAQPAPKPAIAVPSPKPVIASRGVDELRKKLDECRAALQQHQGGGVAGERAFRQRQQSDRAARRRAR